MRFNNNWLLKMNVDASTLSSSDGANVSGDSVIMKTKNTIGYKDNTVMKEVTVCLLCRKLLLLLEEIHPILFLI